MSEPPGIVDAMARVQAIAAMLQPPPAGDGAGAQAQTPTAFADRLAAASAGGAALPPAVKSAQSFPAAGAPGLGAMAPGIPLGASLQPGLVGAVPSAGGPVAAAELDAWMREKVPGSPLVGTGDVFLREGVANGIDPRFLVAVAHHESVLGTARSGRDINNAFGWGPAIPFPSWEANIARVATGLAEGYIGEGLDTVAEIQGKWAPIGAGNDPTDLNSNWTGAVTKMLVEMGGDPAGGVTIGAR